MFLERHLALPLRRAAAQGEGPVLVQGPRGGGKTTLLRHEFPRHLYVTLEDAADRMLARRDPAAFLARLRGPALIDALHRAPELAAHLADPSAFAHSLIAASSLRLPWPAGFTLFELHPPTYAERQRRAPVALESLGRFALVRPAVPPAPAAASWPRPAEPLQEDVHGLIAVHDLDRFLAFAATARSASGSLLDRQALARQAGVSHRTAVRWLEAVDACFLTLRLDPLDLDFGRRLVRRPKLHFLDGVACFESQAVSEIYRNARHAGLDAPLLRYWRDSNGLEIPLVIESGTGAPLLPVMIASEPTPVDEARLRRWMTLAGGVSQAAIVARHPPSSSAAGRKGILRYALSRL